ncbi:MAG: MFS transporter [Clostridia bacterium]|nr:MFS transporter [Clostridia bacterium]
MTSPNYRRTRIACFFAYLSMASIFVLPSMLFVTFHEMYGISYTLLGSLVLVNFCTQMTIDLIFTFFSKIFNIRWTVRLMPLLTTVGLLLYAVLPNVMPQNAYLGLVLGTIVFSVAAGLSEVLLSPVIAAIPSEHPEKDMSMLHSLYGWGVVSAVAISSLYFLLFGTENWMYLAVFLSLFPLVSSFLFCISPIPDMNLHAEDDTPKSKANRGKTLFLCVICIFLGSSAENTMTNWISSYMENALLIPKAVGDILGLAVFAFLLAMTRVLYAKYSPNITKTLLVSMIGAAVCYLIAGLSPSVILAFIACILMGVFTSMLWPGTLIFMEEKLPSPGVAAYALMAAFGDMGASVAPQMLGIVVDKVSASAFAQNLSQTSAVAPEEIGLKVGMLIASVFPILGIALVLYLRKAYAEKK